MQSNVASSLSSWKLALRKHKTVPWQHARVKDAHRGIVLLLLLHMLLLTVVSGHDQDRPASCC